MKSTIKEAKQKYNNVKFELYKQNKSASIYRSILSNGYIIECKVMSENVHDKDTDISIHELNTDWITVTTSDFLLKELYSDYLNYQR